ncbi:hypothetical protein Fbal_2394 [Ferrimonas balearica DSM 9799]|uniref:Uncharacterized protein n=1 Tax=Ferrimonas balearica (strain DSM 9799 / CCM 4581 / KCTC 23876 / PAT) TaxID=550540 RepID=E1SM78_FERBD|nr:hypothetical protein [Ferrimonas balearica]ADN76596.1 hypothetical protein Fbal_2394 [Ferrimonas balearica DSM 9799]MBW3141492.1 hypothetical protein [Ferrimonas balearica]MBW3166591.1 hypothetical protein [Ferrimonas balearica]MBY5982329.1 hypothetical protein [Ferrimonas balearica]MBY6096816.1 hypothetical protein [Ferrimonas balearica]
MTQLTRAQIEWTLLPPLKDVLPYRFENGASFKGFRAECDACGQSIELPQVRGRITPLAGNRCVVSARGRCLCCNAYCEYHYLLSADGTLSASPLAVWDDDHSLSPPH